MKSNINEVKRKIARSIEAKKGAIGKAVDSSMRAIASDSKVNLARNGSIAKGDLLNSIKYHKLEMRVIVESDYAHYVEFGTKSKRKVPPDPQIAQMITNSSEKGNFDDFIRNLRDWAKAKNIYENDAQVYRMALFILEKGVSAKPFFFPAVFKNKLILRKKLIKALRTRR